MNTASTHRTPEPTAPNPGTPRQHGLPHAVQPSGADEEPGPVESEDDIPRDEASGSTADAAFHRASRAATSSADSARRSSETYTPHRSSYTPPSSDEPGPVDSEDDIPREDNDTPRE
jgi:hypothetical protein